MDGLSAPFMIGHHDPRRPLPVTSEIVQLTRSMNYDMLTSPITTSHFHSRVLSLLSSPLSPTSSTADGDITRTRNASPIIVPPLSPSDTPLTPSESISQLIGICCSWIDLCSPDPIIADVSRQVLKLEVAYAAFCGISYVVVPGPRSRGHGATDSGLVQYGRAMMDALNQGPYMQFYVWLPMHDDPEGQTDDEMGDLALFARPQFLDPDTGETRRPDLFGTWEVWNVIRSICKYPSRLCVALSFPKLLPPLPIQSRWYSEPVRLFTLDATTFSKNAKGYPVLPKAHQALISRFIRLKTSPWFLLCDVGSIPPSSGLGINGGGASEGTIFDGSTFPTPAEVSEGHHLKDPTPHLSYMRNLQTKQPVLTALDRFGTGYQDYLQAPLQPLTVNLESITYEVFEKDPIKYDWYERAIARALHDWIEQGKPTSNPDGRVVVAVVGAGRGPLVTRALKASEDVGVAIDMWALEKNPNAYVLLQRHNETTWGHRVNLVKADMRSWRGPSRPSTAKHISPIYNREADDPGEATPVSCSAMLPSSPQTDSTFLFDTATHQPTYYKIDVLVSELLGSFADNELSPECLDGVQHLLNPVHGISIPASYTAHLTPIAAPKLYADISHTMVNTNSNAAEIPYVVMLHAIDYLSTIQPESPSSSPRPASASSPPQLYSKAHARKSPPTSYTPPPPPVPVVGTVWSFQHPNPSLPSLSGGANSTVASEPTISNSHNARHAELAFPVPNRGTCHGLAGYFETVLYDGVELSTNPNTMDQKSEGMISWFPIYFPLKTPLFAPDNSELVVNMWRKTEDRKVWYEWMVDVYLPLPDPASPSASAKGKSKARAGNSAAQATATTTVQRRDHGKRIRIGGSELHSSEKEACLM